MRKMTSILLLMALWFTPLLATSTVGAQGFQDAICDGVSSVDATGGGGGCTTITSTAEDDVKSKVAGLISTFSWVVGIASVVMIIFSGFRYITSGGNPEKVTGAKNNLIYAIIGLVIALLAQFIVKYIVKQAVSI